MSDDNGTEPVEDAISHAVNYASFRAANMIYEAAEKYEWETRRALEKLARRVQHVVISSFVESMNEAER